MHAEVKGNEEVTIIKLIIIIKFIKKKIKEVNMEASEYTIKIVTVIIIIINLVLNDSAFKDSNITA